MAKTKPKGRPRKGRSRSPRKAARGRRKTTRRPRKTTRSARRTAPRKTTRGARKESGALAAVLDVRSKAKRALERLQTEIEQTRSRLERLVDAEETFRRELTGAATGTGTRTRRARTAGRTRRRKGRRRTGTTTTRRRGRPRAEKYFEKLPNTFTLDDVRKLAGGRAGVSIAQWSRSRRIRKTGDKYKKVG